MTTRELASKALDHSDRVEHLVRWILRQVAHVEAAQATKMQECLMHLAKMQDALRRLMIQTGGEE